VALTIHAFVEDGHGILRRECPFPSAAIPVPNSKRTLLPDLASHSSASDQDADPERAERVEGPLPLSSRTERGIGFRLDLPYFCRRRWTPTGGDGGIEKPPPFPVTGRMGHPQVTRNWEGQATRPNLSVST